MKAKIKAIISAATATAVFSVGAITAAAYTKDEQATVYESAIVSDKFVRQENGLTPFEEAILKGEPIYDGRRSCFGEGVVEYDAAQTASVLKTSISLDKVFGSEDGGYQLWSGTFTTDDVAAFSARFTDPDYFSCQTANKNASMTAIDNYSGNYKNVSVRLVYLENGKKVVKFNSGDGVSKTVSTKVNYSGNGELVEAAYYFYLHSGTGETSAYYEVASVHVVDKGYSETSLYQQETYSGRIGGYTYVSADEMQSSVAVPFEEE